MRAEEFFEGKVNIEINFASYFLDEFGKTPECPWFS